MDFCMPNTNQVQNKKKIKKIEKIISRNDWKHPKKILEREKMLSCLKTKNLPQHIFSYNLQLLENIFLKF